MTERRCVDCGVDISWRGRAAKRCEAHATAKQREQASEYQRNRRNQRNRIINPRTCVDCGVDISERGNVATLCVTHGIERSNEKRSRSRARWNKLNPDKAKASKRKSAKKYAYKYRGQASRWRAENLDIARAAERRRYAADPNKMREKNRKNYKKRSDLGLHSSRRRDTKDTSEVLRLRAKDREAALKRKAINPGKVRRNQYATWKRYAAKHPDAVRANSRKQHRVRKAMKLNQMGVVSPNIEDALLEHQRFKCAAPHCRKALGARKTYHLDHIMPFALGGLHDDSNLQILCAHCNVSKHAKHPDDWLTEHGELPLR